MGILFISFGSLRMLLVLWILNFCDLNLLKTNFERLTRGCTIRSKINKLDGTGRVFTDVSLLCFFAKVLLTLKLDANPVHV